MNENPNPPEIVVDPAKRVVTAFGVKMTFEFLEALTKPSPPHTWFRIIKWAGSNAVGIESYSGDVRSPAILDQLAAFRAEQLQLGTPSEDCIPEEPAAAVAWLIYRRAK